MPVPAIIRVAAPDPGPGDDTVGLVYPTDVRFGDILIALLFCDAGAAQTLNLAAFSSSPIFFEVGNTGDSVRRGVAVFARAAVESDVAASGVTFTIPTSGGTGTHGGCVALIRDGHTVGGIHVAGEAGITSSTTPAPASVTTTLEDELVIAAIAYANTGTITTLAPNEWSEGAEVQNDGANSYSFQSIVVPAAATISGDTATLGTSGNWGVVTFAVKPLVKVFLPSPIVVN